MLTKLNIIKLNSKFYFYKPEYNSKIGVNLLSQNLSESKIDLAYFFDQIFFKKLKLNKKDSSEYLFQSSRKMVMFDFFINFKNIIKFLFFFKYLWLSRLKLDKLLYFNSISNNLYLSMNSGQIYLDFMFNIYQQKNFKILIKFNTFNLYKFYFIYLLNFYIPGNSPKNL